MANTKLSLALSIFIISYSYPTFSQDGVMKEGKTVSNLNQQDNTITNRKKPILPIQHKTKERQHFHQAQGHIPQNKKTQINRIPVTTSKQLSEKKITDNEQDIRVAIGESVVLKLNDFPTKIIIGSDQIADVLSLEKDKNIVLTGKNIGLTNLIVLGEKDKVIIDAQVTTFINEKNTVRVYSPGKKSILSCTPRCFLLQPQE
ncbi:pilus assembly protein N-terminal domain-containing protein [Candidatus Liberibacter brunswickensis]|uniref:pilus assembly protein N-terminal domain-containing protein n=1 Tax=Candidatus Liberibacter brunswickensis TaxID=1968796 RepID=UPI002FE1899B